jgi:ABC-type glutathione transport system ATPase component
VGRDRLHRVENRLSAITENWWLIFAPILILFALLSPEGIQGLVQRIRGRERWTLTRNTIPARPAAIKPYESVAASLDPNRPILTTKRLSKNFGSLITARDIDLEVRPYVLHSIIGPNGAGKTTFYNMLTGVLPPAPDRSSSRARRSPGCRPMPGRLGISRSFQILSIFVNLTVFENVRVAVRAASRPRGLWQDAHDMAALNERTWSILDAVGLADRAAEPCATFRTAPSACSRSR